MFAADQDHSAALFHDGMDAGQSQPGSGAWGLGCEKGLENMI
jgi:hypothetical protein